MTLCFSLKILLMAFITVAHPAHGSPPDTSALIAKGPPVPIPHPGRRKVSQSQLPLCGDQYYDPLEYTCFDRSFLCPWQNGYPMSRCGVTNKCFLPFRYGCNNGELVEIPPANGPFELVAINLHSLAFVKVHECGLKFWLNGNSSCTLCPPQVGDACPPGVDTVLNPGRSMDTMVPGGQRYFVDRGTGALQVSTPHSGVDPDGAIYDINALQNGSFGIFPNNGWMACQPASNETTVPSGGDVAWQIFAQLPGLKFAPDCIPINMVTLPWKAPADTSAAAWEYV